MKKVMFILLMAVAFCGNASAQKGMQGIGVSIGALHVRYGEDFVNYLQYREYEGHTAPLHHSTPIYLGIKYQYNLSDWIRLEPTVGYALKTKSETPEFYTAMLNADVFFCKPQTCRPYLFAGIGYTHAQLKSQDSDGKLKSSAFGANLGLGLDYRLSRNLLFQIEVSGVLLDKYMKNGDGYEYEVLKPIGGKFTLGLCYNF